MELLSQVGYGEDGGSKNRQTTAQSSIFDVGNLRRQARTAHSTRAQAAVACDGAEDIMFTTSSLERTSQTCTISTPILDT